jgi:hypothetical protein
MSSLIALDRRLLPPGTAGEERNDVPGAQAVIAGDRLINGGGGQFAARRGNPSGTFEGGGIGEAAGIGGADGIGDAGGIGVSSAAMSAKYQ